MIDTVPSASQIVPRIVLSIPTDRKPDIVFSEDDCPVERHLVADLCVAYAFDEPKCFVMVARRDLTRLGLDERSIDSLALANLTNRMQRLEPEFQELSNGVFILSGAGDLTAAMLLLDEVWQQATDRLREGLLIRGALVAAVPARDMVAFTCAQNRRGLEFMKSTVSQVIQAGGRTLTRQLLVRYDKSWSVFDGCES